MYSNIIWVMFEYTSNIIRILFEKSYYYNTVQLS